MSDSVPRPGSVLPLKHPLDSICDDPSCWSCAGARSACGRIGCEFQGQMHVHHDREPDGLTTARRQQLNAFVEEIRAVLVSGHQEYGETAETIYSVLGPPACGYAISEKGLRYGRKGNKKDLVKAATYAFLGWTVAK